PWSEATSGPPISCSISRYRRAIDSSRSIISSFPRCPAPPGNRHRTALSQRLEVRGGFPTRGACPPCEFRSCRRSGALLLTLAGAVEGGDGDLEHVVGGLARGELLGAQDREQGDADERVVAVPCHEPDQLEADARNHWDGEHAARNDPEEIGMKQRHDAEDDDAHNQYDKKEPRTAARVQRARAANRRHIQRPPRFEGVDGLVLGPVVLKHAPNVWQKCDCRQVAEDQADPDQTLDENEKEASTAVYCKARQQQRQA